MLAALVQGLAQAEDDPETIRFHPIGSPPWITALSDFPFSARNDPRKINELSVYQERIYLGYGNVEENLGPTEIGYYDPDRHEFVTEFLLGSELTERFKVIGSELYVPSSDSAHFFNQADYAMRTHDGLWRRNDRVSTLHNQDLISFNGRLVSAGSGGIIADGKQGTILTTSSSDHGISWQPLHTTLDFSPSAARFRAIIPFQGRALTSGMSLNPNGCNFDCPEAATGLDILIGAYATFADQLVYIKLGSNGDEPTLTSFDGTSAQPVTKAIDLCVDGMNLTILTSDGRLQVTGDLQTWREIPVENLPANACSLVTLHDRLYIGTTNGELWVGQDFISNELPLTRRTRNDLYGQALAVGDSMIAAGVPAAGTTPWNHGEVHLNNDNVLKSPEPSNLGYFGSYLAMGNAWLAVAESKRDQESVHLYHRQSPESEWEWKQSLSGSPITSIALEENLLAVGRLAEGRDPASDLFDLYHLQDDAWLPLLTDEIRDLRGEIDDYSSFLNAVALTSDTLLLGISGDLGDNQGQGLALIYQKNESEWSRVAKLDQVIPFSSFGSAVAVNHRWIVISAPRTLDQGVQLGRVYVYDRLADQSLTFTLSPPEGKGGHFGKTLALNGDRLVVGSPGEAWETRTSGAAYVYNLDAENEPALVSRLGPMLPDTRGFGNAIAWNHGRLVIGSENVPGTQAALTIITEAIDQDFDRLEDTWEQTHFDTLAASPSADADSDGQTNLEEMLAQTNPQDPADYLRIASVTNTSTGIRLTWRSVPDVTYAVMASPSLTNTTWLLADTLTATTPTTAVSLSSSDKAQFYRVVALP